MLDYYNPPRVSVGLQMLHSPCPYVRQRDAQLSGPSGVVLACALEAAVTLGEACWITITHPGCRWGCKCYILHVPMLTARCAAVGSQRGRSCCALEAAVTLGEACWITSNPTQGVGGAARCYILHVPMLTARCAAARVPAGLVLAALWKQP
jgi:hypothetical protein